MSDDLIKRSDAIEVLQEAIMAYPPVMKGCGETRDSTLEEAISLILDIPSANRPQGEWIYWRDNGIKRCKCARCLTSYGCLDTPYCPNCGADMRGADDE